MGLSEFQSGFIAALYGEPGFAPAAERGFQVYRNTVMQGCVEALRANFPTVEQLVGTEWFSDAARLYARRHPPVDRSLMYYGDQFAAFLASVASARGLPYLPGVAQLDMLWLRAHMAADQPSLDPARLAELSPLQLGMLRLQLHPSTSWAWFDDIPVFTIWHSTRSGRAVPEELEWHGEGVLLLRRCEEVIWMELEHCTTRFLDACLAGATLAEAAAEFAGEPDPASQFATLLSAGTFAASSQH